MAGLSVVTLILNISLLDPRDWRPMVAPTIAILPITAVVFIVWSKRRSQTVNGLTLILGMVGIMLSAALVGVNAGGEFHDRQLYVMLLVALTALVIFAVPLSWTVAIAAAALGLHLVFLLHHPEMSGASAVAAIAYIACGFGAAVTARRTMTLLAQKQFLLELQRQAHVAELADANERLLQLSRNDPLTGVANRRHMSDTLATCWSAKDGLVGTAILMCDIDDFKKVNDRLGHAEGDRCLVEVARRIAMTLRRDGSQLARYGGEEFMVLLPHIGERDAMLVAERIRRTVEDAGLSNPDSVVGPHVTVSVGVAVLERDLAHIGPEELQRYADEALYEAKRAGRNRVSLYRTKEASLQS